jgi:hypothetical protein
MKTANNYYNTVEYYLRMTIRHIPSTVNLAVRAIWCNAFLFFVFALFLAGLHKVHPAYRMVNAGWAGGRASLIGTYFV